MTKVCCKCFLETPIQNFKRHEKICLGCVRSYERESSRRYRTKHSERRKQSAREWARRNRSKGLKYFRDRYNLDPIFNLTIKVRRRIYMAIRGAHKGLRKKDKTINLLGCSFIQLKDYIESKFTSGMTWEKVMTGDIHLDHIIPCAAFDLSDLEQQKKCFHYINLQPLWSTDNIIKGTKILI